MYAVSQKYMESDLRERESLRRKGSVIYEER